MQGANSVYNLKWYSIMEPSPTLAGGDQAGSRKVPPSQNLLLRIQAPGTAVGICSPPINSRYNDFSFPLRDPAGEDMMWE